MTLSPMKAGDITQAHVQGTISRAEDTRAMTFLAAIARPIPVMDNLKVVGQGMICQDMSARPILVMDNLKVVGRIKDYLVRQRDLTKDCRVNLGIQATGHREVVHHRGLTKDCHLELRLTQATDRQGLVRHRNQIKDSRLRHSQNVSW